MTMRIREAMSLQALLRTALLWSAALGLAVVCRVPAEAQVRSGRLDRPMDDGRLALVIGNADYAQGALPNPLNDARVMASTLDELGFGVVVVENATEREMVEAIRDFGRRLRQGGDGAGVFYYAGHGVEVGGVNYMIPIGVDIADETDVEFEAVAVDEVLARMERERGVNIVVLDASRDAPFSPSWSGSGLARQDPPFGTLIAYATEPGATASDGDGDNGTYTAELVNQMRVPQHVALMFQRVREEVVGRTGGAQIPWYASALTSGFSFTDEAVAPVQPAEAVGQPETVEASLGLGLADVRLIQRGLADMGYDPQESDGLIGRGTREALRLWQKARGLQVSGHLSAATAEVLRIAGADAVREDSVSAAAAARARADSVARAQADAAAAAAAAAAAERVRAGREFRDCAACPEMVVVPRGTFGMGPGGAHTVRIEHALAVGKYEVTFAEWDECVSAGGCDRYRPDDEGWGRGSRPVINIRWEDARDYAAWLSRETGEPYRLLSEAEWEYVARAGTETARYWGEGEVEQCGHGNGADAALGLAHPESDADMVPCNDGHAYTALVGSFAPNAWGLYDMLGNVWEWTADCGHGSYAYAGPTDGSVWEGGDCTRRMLRGGSWHDTPRYLRSDFRSVFDAGTRAYYFGFRVARTLPLN